MNVNSPFPRKVIPMGVVSAITVPSTPLLHVISMESYAKEKSEFIGKDVLAKQKEEGPTRKIVGFEMLDKGIPRSGYTVLKDGEEIGVVTTGYKSPTLDKSIGLALIKAEHSSLGSDIQIQVRKKTINAKVVSKRFLSKNYKK